MINEQLLDEALKESMRRGENRELNPWEYDAKAFLEKYGDVAQLAAWQLYSSNAVILSRWREELDNMLKNHTEEKSEEVKELAALCMHIVEDAEACQKVSREVLVNELF